MSCTLKVIYSDFYKNNLKTFTYVVYHLLFVKKIRLTRFMEATNIKLPSQLLSQEDVNRINRMFESPKKATTSDSSDTSSLYNVASALLCPVISKHFYNVRNSKIDSSLIRHDGTFMGYRPTVSTRFPEAAAMIYCTVNIGQSSNNDIQLNDFGHCNYVSSRHATIFYNRLTNQHELLNYSCYGTFIDNLLYGNNEFFYNTKSKKPVSTRKIKMSKSKKKAINAKLVAINRQERMKCSCISNNLECTISNWEGAINVKHGTVLRFGCIPFVFSIMKENK